MFDFASNAKHKEAAHFLETFWKGLDYLCQQVERAERERGKSLGLTEETAKNVSYCDFGSHPDDWLVCNYFVWYANALSNFISVFAKAFPVSEDLEADFANVITWRHKVAAHTSWVWPKDDSASTQDMSIMFFPEFGFGGDGHFEVGGMQIVSPTDGASCADWRWGLVHTHERLEAIVSKYASCDEVVAMPHVDPALLPATWNSIGS
jgi:hypothetical protein